MSDTIDTLIWKMLSEKMSHESKHGICAIVLKGTWYNYNNKNMTFSILQIFNRRKSVSIFIDGIYNLNNTRQTIRQDIFT